jgi:hypothetical protein
MSANLYSIDNLLVGKYYRSRSVEGEIVEARKDDRALWYGEDTEPYLVRIRKEGGGYTYRTVAVSVA